MLLFFSIMVLGALSVLGASVAPHLARRKAKNANEVQREQRAWDLAMLCGLGDPKTSHASSFSHAITLAVGLYGEAALMAMFHVSELAIRNWATDSVEGHPARRRQIMQALGERAAYELR